MSATVAKLTKSVPTVADAPASDSRAALRAAIRHRNAAAETVRSATEAASRGRTLLAQAEAALAALGDVDRAVTAHRAGKIKQFATDGGSEPDMSLPADLIERRAARDEAKEHVAATRAAHDALVGELNAARDALRRVELTVTNALLAVILDRVASEAVELEAAWRKMWTLYDSVSAISGQWLPGPTGPAGPRPLNLPRAVISILQTIAPGDYRQHPGGFNREQGRAGEAWRQWYSALSQDPDAAFGGS